MPVIDHDMVAVGETASFCLHVHKWRLNRCLPESTLANSSRSAAVGVAICRGRLKIENRVRAYPLRQDWRFCTS